MKKILPVIITLVGLSLLGLIILQASWLNNLLQLREQQISFKISKAHYAVTSDLGKQLYNKTPRQLQGLRLRDDMFSLKKKLEEMKK